MIRCRVVTISTVSTVVGSPAPLSQLDPGRSPCQSATLFYEEWLLQNLVPMPRAELHELVSFV
jgi:hypothetical protein